MLGVRVCPAGSGARHRVQARVCPAGSELAIGVRAQTEPELAYPDWEGTEAELLALPAKCGSIGAHSENKLAWRWRRSARKRMEEKEEERMHLCQDPETITFPVGPADPPFRLSENPSHRRGGCQAFAAVLFVSGSDLKILPRIFPPHHGNDSPHCYP